MSAVEETLAWEAEKRPRAATAAVVAGLLTLAGNILLTLVFRDSPTEGDGFVSLTEALGARAAGRAPDPPSLIVAQTDFYGDKAAILSLSTVLTALAAVCAGLTLLYLHRAAAARGARGELPRYAAYAGLVLYPLGRLVGQVSTWWSARDFEDAAVRTADGAREALGGGATALGTLLEFFGAFSLALAFVLISLNAMRAGLLTRFLGILGILVGALTVFQLDQPGVVRAFWLIAVGLLIAGRLPSGVPPAWATGRAEPWPSQQQVREQRAAARRGTAGPAPDAPPDASSPESPVGDGVGPKRKRKRRR